MLSLLPGRAFWLLVFLTSTLGDCRDAPTQEDKDIVFDNNTWTLEPGKSEAIRSVASLQNGVYLFKLAKTRLGCLVDSPASKGM